LSTAKTIQFKIPNNGSVFDLIQNDKTQFALH